jgi:hypothetical protein
VPLARQPSLLIASGVSQGILPDFQQSGPAQLEMAGSSLATSPLIGKRFLLHLAQNRARWLNGSLIPIARLGDRSTLDRLTAFMRGAPITTDCSLPPHASSGIPTTILSGPCTSPKPNGTRIALFSSKGCKLESKEFDIPSDISDPNRQVSRRPACLIGFAKSDEPRGCAHQLRPNAQK